MGADARGLAHCCGACFFAAVRLLGVDCDGQLFDGGVGEAVPEIFGCGEGFTRDVARGEGQGDGLFGKGVGA